METVACPDCDLLQRVPTLPPPAKTRCPRCGALIASYLSDPLDRPLALSVAALIALIVANTAPLMGLEAVGREASTTIVGGVQEMWLSGREITAVLVAFAAIVAPASYIALMLAALVYVRRPPAPRWVGELMRGAQFVKPWAMLEVMLLGILVALIKIAELATVVPGVGIYAVGALVVLFAAIAVTFDPREVWRRVRWANGNAPSAAEQAGVARPLW